MGAKRPGPHSHAERGSEITGLLITAQFHYSTRVSALRAPPQNLFSSSYRLGIRKLLDAAVLPREAFERFKHTGGIMFADGVELLLEEIEAMSVREFSLTIRQLRRVARTAKGMAEESAKHEHQWQMLLREIEQKLATMEEHGSRKEVASAEVKLRSIARQLKIP